MGVYRRLLDYEGQRIDEAKWAEAQELHEPVGLCERCHHPMKALAPEEHNGLRYFGAQCLQCEAEVSMPEGRLAVRRSRQKVA